MITPSTSMRDAEPEVVIAMGFDGAYVPHAASTIASIVRNAPGARLRFLILYADVDADLKAKLESVAPDARFDWIVIKDDDFPDLPDRGHISRATLFRMGLETLAPPECRRAVYLDADLTVLGDIRELWTMDLAGLPIAAARDAYMRPEEFAERWGLPEGGSYFNAGVLVIDMDRMRAEKLLSKALAFQTAHAADLPFNDQDALNWAFWKNYRALDPTWNTQRPMALPDEIPAEECPNNTPVAFHTARVVHFTTAQKPWLATTWHPWSWIYWDNLARTPFLKDVAKREGVGPIQRFRLWLRWQKRRGAGAL
jgi:lipopolysaccharide biosynthesis glycosyltransferase